TMRVVSQIATDFTETAFPFAGVSGMLEVSGLAIWGIHLWRIMAGGDAVWSCHGPSIGLSWNESNAPPHFVADVLARYPRLIDTFVAFGFKPLTNPILRRTLARGVTIRRACRLTDVDEAGFIDVLNDQREKLTASKVLLTVCESDAVSAKPRHAI